jgi:hypothetical protein
LPFTEEYFKLVVVAYDRIHPKVQEAAGVLISILIKKGEIFDAKRYAQVTYGNLRDKKNGTDQESEQIAKGAYNLADAFYQQKGDSSTLLQAEELARESFRIRTLIFCSDHHFTGCCCDLLARILQVQKKLGDETRSLY